MTAKRHLHQAELAGLPASPGIAIGKIFRLDKVDALAANNSSADCDPAREAVLLAQAVDAAKTVLAAQIESANGEEATCLAHQAALLENEDFAEQVLDRIIEGSSALSAWNQVSSAWEGDGQGGPVDQLSQRVLRHLSGEQAAHVPAGSIIVASDITPSRFIDTDWQGGGLALMAGSSGSHVAMLARSHAVPAAVNLGWSDIDGHDQAILDGENGKLIVSPSEATLADYQSRKSEMDREREATVHLLDQPAVTEDGTPISVMINVNNSKELALVNPATCDGIGLVRSEFLFQGAHALTDEEAHYIAYRRILSWAQGKPVFIRALDGGGDKPLPGLPVADELNPMLGVRGIRLLLQNPQLLTVQLRALTRAATHGPLTIILPMITTSAEFDAVSTCLEEMVADLGQGGVACVRPPLGIMVEVPAVALRPDLFPGAAYFSIGTNDLVQFTLASARDRSGAAQFDNPAHPAVTTMIKNVVHHGGGRVSICGDMAADPAHVEQLLRLGVRTLSVAPSAIGRVKARISQIDLSTQPGVQ